MKPDIKAKWVEALRSGKYKQSQSVLRGASGFCCLGVLCDLAASEGVGEWECHNGGYVFDNMQGLLPYNVRKWADISDESPRAGDYCLTVMNDSGKSFAHIADTIEKYL